MTLSPAFRLLGKFTEGIAAERIFGSPTWQEVHMVSEYLGVDISGSDIVSATEKLSAALTEQNRFLTAYLSSDEIENCDLYHRSSFIREIVINNRREQSSP
jgi:hypothetical protein